MANASKIIRKSIHALFQNYNSFAYTAILLVFPFSASVLLSQAFTPSTSRSLETLSARFHALFRAAGFPASYQFFSLLNLKLSQTIFSFFFTLPFALTFLMFAKAAVVQRVLQSPQRRLALPPFSSLFRLYRLLLPTCIFNSFVILSANAAVFSLLFLAFNTVDMFSLSSDYIIHALSAAGAVLYSIVIANTMVACNLSMIVSVSENCSGYSPILKACVLIRGNEATAMTLALPANLCMAVIEALFQFKVVKFYLTTGGFSLSIVGEAFLIAYIYSFLVVLDTIISCMLYTSCKPRSLPIWENGCDQNSELEPEDKGALQA